MKVIRNFIYNSVYQVLLLLLPIITAPYVSRVIGPKGVGTYSYTLSIVSYFVLFGTLGLTLYGNRQIAYEQNDKVLRSQTFWEIFFLRTICLLFSEIIFLFSTPFGHSSLSIFFQIQSIGLISSVLDISFYFMGMENFRVTAVRSIIFKILSVCAIFIFVRNQSDTWIYILILNLSTLFSNISLFPYLRNEISLPVWRKLHIFRPLFPSLWLFIPTIATNIYLQLNKTMLGSLKGLVQAGLFQQSDYLIKVIIGIVTSLGAVMMPRIANLYAKKNSSEIIRLLRESFSFISFISLPATFGIMAVSHEFAPLFFGERFSEVGNIMFIESGIIFLIGWSNIVGIQYLIPTNRMKAFTLSVVSGSVFNFFLNLLLIPKYGAVGAATATLFSEFSVTFIQFCFVRRHLPIFSMLKETWKYLISSFLMFILVSFVNLSFISNVFDLLVRIVLGCIVYLTLVYCLKADVLIMLKDKIKKHRS